MSVIRFTLVTLLLALLMMNRLAAPRAVDSGPEIEKSDVQLSGNDAKSFLDNPASNEKRGITEECNEGCTAHEVEEYHENRRGNNGWR
ncbi:hypothetical protein ACROYT_G030770 [Oculina patagonica]